MEGKEEAGCPVQVKAIVPLPDDAGRSGSRLFIRNHFLIGCSSTRSCFLFVCFEASSDTICYLKSIFSFSQSLHR